MYSVYVLSATEDGDRMSLKCRFLNKGQWMVPGIVILICHRPLKLIFFCLFAGLGEEEENHGLLRTGEDMYRVPEEFNFSGDSAHRDAYISSSPCTMEGASLRQPPPLMSTPSACSFHHHILPSCSAYK
jgi:hypothetical protein